MKNQKQFDTKTELQYSIAHLTTFIETREEAIWSIDKHYKYILLNSYFKNDYKKVFGIELKPGMDALDILPEQEKIKWKKFYDQVFTGEKLEFELKEMLDNKTSYFEVRLNPIVFRGNTIGVSAISINVTDQKTTKLQLMASEKRYRSVSELTSDYSYSYLVESDGNIVNEWVTGAFKKVTGYTRDGLMKLGGWEKLIYPEDLHLTYKQFKKLLSNVADTIEYRIITKDKKIKWMRDFARPEWSDDEKRVVRIEGAIQDITKQKNFESQLKESQRQLSTLMSNLPGMAYRCANDKSWTMEFISDGCKDLTGYSSKELLNNTIKSYADLIHLEDRKMVWDVVQEGVNNKNPFQMNYRINTKGGEVKWVWEQGQGVFDKNGKLEAIEGFIADITERKLTEEKLKESEARYRAVLEQSHDCIFLSDTKNKKVLESSPAMGKLLGYSIEELSNLTLYDIIAHDKKSINENVNDIIKDGYKFIGERKYKRKDKFLIDVEVSVSLITYKDTQVMSVVSRDITERKHNEEIIKENEAKLNAIVQSVNEGIIYTDVKGKVLFVNQPLLNIAGIPAKEIIGKNAIHLAKKYITKKQIPSLLKRIDEAFIGHFLPSFELTFNNQILEISITFDNINKRVTGIIRDVTDRIKSQQEKEQLEKQLFRAQKLETIGTLASGIAHDFNNILAPIMGYTDMALLNLDKTDPLYEDLKHVLSGAHRARELIKQILLFSKQSEKDRQPLVLQTLLKETLKLLRPSIPKTIDIIQNIDDSVKTIEADATQIHQVIVNLCTNAAHAMEDKGGKLIIGLTQERIEPALAKMWPNLQLEDYAIITISDSGTGMDEETLDRIFEPFYTTKSTDKGTGLGLSVVHGIIRSHKGEIMVESQPGKGTRFKLYLPIVRSKNIKSKPLSTAIKKGTEYIMIVDDEAIVISIVKKMLEKFGYKTESYINGVGALNAFKKHPGKYDLIITDLTMPQMTGLELAEQINSRKPDIPIIIITGYEDSISHEMKKKYKISHVLNKPIDIKEINEAVRQGLIH